MFKVETKINQRDVDGVWAKYPGTEAEFLIARAGNEAFWRASDKIEAPFQKQIRRNKLSTKQAVNNQCRAMAKAILMDWKGLSDESGEKLEYTEENAFAVLRHNAELREWIVDFAGETENYRAEEIAATAKKSKSS